MVYASLEVVMRSADALRITAQGPLWPLREQENTQQGTLATGVTSLRGFGCPVEWVGRRRCRQAGSGMARRGQGAAELLSPRPAIRKMQGQPRAERVSRPAREKNRRRRVLVVAIRSPRPIRAVQRARLWATRRSGPRGDGSARRRTWGRVWHSRSRRGGDGQPPVRATPRPGR